MYKNLLAGLCACLWLSGASAQEPVHWSYKAELLPDGLYQISIHASIAKPWHIYATSVPKGVVSLPTTITFKSSPLLRLDGAVYTDTPSSSYIFDKEVTFEQKVKLLTKVKTNITGAVTFMACTDKECLPPITLPFSLSLNPTSKKAS